MLKVLSLRLNIAIKKVIIRLYPWAVKARQRVSWPKVGKVSLYFLAYPALTFLFAATGLEMVARFMVSPFSPSDKANVWFFFIVASVPLLLPLVAAVIFWLPKFLTSRFSVPLLKAAIITLAISPLVYLFLVFAEYILAAVFAVLVLFMKHDKPTHDELSHLNPWVDVQHPDYLLYNDD